MQNLEELYRAACRIVEAAQPVSADLSSNRPHGSMDHVIAVAARAMEISPAQLKEELTDETASRCVVPAGEIARLRMAIEPALRSLRRLQAEDMEESVFWG